MRANTDRSGRLDFDQFAAVYDRGRMPIPQTVVQQAIKAIGLRHASSVIEIDCRSGRLTSALLSAGMKVTGVEPGSNFQALLQRKFGADDNFDMLSDDFERLAMTNKFEAVVAANAFHWLDPRVSYHRAASALAPMGHLWLLWEIPILSGELQSRLNATLRDQFFGVEWDTQGFLFALPDSLRDGRQEIRDSKLFREPWWIVHELTCYQTATELAQHILSYHSVAKALPDHRRDIFVEIVEQTLALGSSDRVTFETVYYSCFARVL